MSSRSGNAGSGWILVGAAAFVAVVKCLVLLMAGLEYIGNRVTVSTPTAILPVDADPSELRSAPDAIAAAIDAYDDFVIGCFAPVPERSHEFSFDNGTTTAVDQFDLLKDMRCNVIVMGVINPDDGKLTACAAWEIRSDNQKARMIQPENCVPR